MATTATSSCLDVARRLVVVVVTAIGRLHGAPLGGKRLFGRRRLFRGYYDGSLAVIIIITATTTGGILGTPSPFLRHSGVAQRLQLNDGDQVVLLETLREVDGRPFCVCSHFLPLPQFQGVLEHYDAGSLHQYIEDSCNTRLRRKESLVSAVIPTKDDCILLNMPHNMPVLRVKSLNVCEQSESPIEYVVTRFRGDAAQLAILPKQ